MSVVEWDFEDRIINGKLMLNECSQNIFKNSFNKGDNNGKIIALALMHHKC